MAKNPPDDRLVDLALKNDTVAHRKEDPGLIQKYLNNRDAEVRALVAEHNIDNICKIAKTTTT